MYRESVQVDIVLKDEIAVVPYKELLSDCCEDVVAPTEKEIAQNVWEFEIGVAFQIDRDTLPWGIEHWNISIDGRARSSVWKTGMILSNCIGTIDEDFTGVAKFIFYHVNTDLPRYKVGDKIAQIKLGFTTLLNFNVVKELEPRARGEKSYGSTGLEHKK